MTSKQLTENNVIGVAIICPMGIFYFVKLGKNYKNFASNWGKNSVLKMIYTNKKVKLDTSLTFRLEL